MTLKRDIFICKKRHTYLYRPEGALGGLHTEWRWRYNVEKRPIYIQKETYLPSNTRRCLRRATRQVTTKIWRWKETHLYAKRDILTRKYALVLEEGYTVDDEEDMTWKRDPFISKKNIRTLKHTQFFCGRLHVRWRRRYDVEKRPIYMQKEIYSPANTHRRRGRATCCMMMKIWSWKETHLYAKRDILTLEHTQVLGEGYTLDDDEDMTLKTVTDIWWVSA